MFYNKFHNTNKKISTIINNKIRHYNKAFGTQINLITPSVFREQLSHVLLMHGLTDKNSSETYKLNQIIDFAKNNYDLCIISIRAILQSSINHNNNETNLALLLHISHTITSFIARLRPSLIKEDLPTLFWSDSPRFISYYGSISDYASHAISANKNKINQIGSLWLTSTTTTHYISNELVSSGLDDSICIIEDKDLETKGLSLNAINGRDGLITLIKAFASTTKNAEFIENILDKVGMDYVCEIYFKTNFNLLSIPRLLDKLKDDPEAILSIAKFLHPYKKDSELKQMLSDLTLFKSKSDYEYWGHYFVLPIVDSLRQIKRILSEGEGIKLLDDNNKHVIVSTTSHEKAISLYLACLLEHKMDTTQLRKDTTSKLNDSKVIFIDRSTLDFPLSARLLMFNKITDSTSVCFLTKETASSSSKSTSQELKFTKVNSNLLF